ncbi:MAG: 50S ribosomal protein L21 [candidate division KSB1 bacterium]|nr:50S ribosomal protein L21 [candidate division KSB1 bacterium]MDZ7272729.1 50S ribosomal protein L21 [candidate division KSB1 bacterium]MDZ7284246.1 50S ribosomal protein L21 [candidate division KSB1 bacterium]MDZ7297355.1 50S ribosomal protein L21 [candidate division KSB1 bacterium]MDZ7307064.1 50S ribosomal protein L21 [candidate division KSB1 bacterium]
MYALVEIAGEQFRVEKNAKIRTQKLAGEYGTSVSFDRVLLVNNEGQMLVGQPLVAGAKVEGTIVDQDRDPKVLVFKKKRRKGYRKLNGHRQHKTVVRIDNIIV